MVKGRASMRGICNMVWVSMPCIGTSNPLGKPCGNMILVSTPDKPLYKSSFNVMLSCPFDSPLLIISPNPKPEQVVSIFFVASQQRFNLLSHRNLSTYVGVLTQTVVHYQLLA